MEELNDVPATAEVSIERVDAPYGVTLVLAGELDISNVAELETVVADILDWNRGDVTFDLEGLRFLDSAGIAVIVGVATTVGRVSLRNPQPAVRRVIELTGLSELLPCQP